jgi:hypothetical protein
MPFATLNDAEEKELWRLSESPFFTPSFIYVIQSPVKTTKSELISLTRRNDSKMYSSSTPWTDMRVTHLHHCASLKFLGETSDR